MSDKNGKGGKGGKGKVEGRMDELYIQVHICIYL